MQNTLFYRINIFDVIGNQVEQLKLFVRQLSRQQVEEGEEKLVERLVEQFGLTVPVLNENGIEATEEETQVDVSRDPNRIIFDRSKPFYTAGTVTTIHVPFAGEAILFDVRPETFNLNPPRGDVVGQELQLRFTVIQGSPDIKPLYQQTLRDVKQHLDWLRPSAERLKGQLQSVAVSEIQKRKQQIDANKTALASLGIPIRRRIESGEHKAPTYEEMPPQAKSASTKPVTEEWDFFVSHASEDKEAIAKPLAEALRHRNYRVWYDAFSLTLGDSLRASIDRGLARSRFGIVILSKTFFEKHWPAQELNGLATREINGKKVILPVWHEVTFEDVRNYSPTLADRLAVKTDKGLEQVIAEIIKVL